MRNPTLFEDKMCEPQILRMLMQIHWRSILPFLTGVVPELLHGVYLIILDEVCCSLVQVFEERYQNFCDPDIPRFISSIDAVVV